MIVLIPKIETFGHRLKAIRTNLHRGCSPMVFATTLCANDLLSRLNYKMGSRFEFLRAAFVSILINKPNSFPCTLKSSRYPSRFQFLQIARTHSNLGTQQAISLHSDSCPENVDIIEHFS